MIISNKSKLATFLASLLAIYAGLVIFLGAPFLLTLQLMLLAVVIVPASIGTSGYIFRYMVRERQALARVKKNKERTVKSSRSLPSNELVRYPVDQDGYELTWYELKPQSIQSESAKTSLEELTSAIKSLGTKAGHTISEIRSRPVHSFILRRSENGIVNLYIGTSRLDAASSLQTFAQRIGYTIEQIKGRPPIGFGAGYTIASRPKRIDHQAISEAGKEMQGTITALSGSRENKFVGNVIVTFEGAQDFEIRRFMANSNEQSIEYGGEMNKSAGGASGGASVGAKTSTLASTLLRATFTVTADSSSGESSGSAFDNVATSMDSLPFVMRSHDVEHWHKKKSWYALAAYWSLAAVAGVLNLVPFPLLIAASIPVIAATVATVMQPEWLVSAPMKRSIQRGYIPVPVSTRFSLRWFFMSIIASFRRNAGGSEKVDNEIGWPSSREVVPFYASPMAELIMPNRGSMQNNQTRERVPLVELERDFEGFTSDADIVVGVTSKKQPVNWSIQDQNLGISGFGKPNSGKTNLMQIVFLRSAQLSVSRDDMFISPILFENKGSGAYDMWRWIKNMPKAEMFEINRPKSKYRLCIEGERFGDTTEDGRFVGVQEVTENINSLLDYMQFAFGLREAPRAMNNLRNGLFIASLLSADEMEEMDLNQFININRPNLMKLALIVLQGDTRIDISKKLESLANDDFSDPGDEENKHEYQRKRALSEYIGRHLTTSKRNDNIQIMESAVTKLSPLASCPMFEPLSGQVEVPIGHVVEKGAPTIINFGPYKIGEFEGGAPRLRDPEREEVTGRTMKMVQKAYWDYVRSHNSGWQAMNKFSQIYSDEASLFGLSNESEGVEDNVVGNIADQGRAFGASQMLLTQRYSSDHISRGVREVMLSSDTFLQFRQSNTSDAEHGIEALGGERNIPYTPDNILRMPIGTSVGYISRNHNRTNAFTIMTPPFEAIAPVICNEKGNVTDEVSSETIYKAMMEYYKRAAIQRNKRRKDVADRAIESKSTQRALR